MTGDDVVSVVAPGPPASLVILGQPVAHSLSPVFQGAALRALGFAQRYERREVPPSCLNSVLAECGAANCAGNVTMPHKEAVHALAVRRTDAARRTGAVNTFWWDHGQLVGHNTDVDGVRATVRALWPAGIVGDVVILGAGGASAAALVAIDSMRSAASDIIVVARTSARAHALVQRVYAGEASSRVAQVVSDAAEVNWSTVRLVVNATPCGMHGHDALPCSVDMLAPETAVFDLVYRREGTAWVAAARARGLRAEDGLRMLVEQGAAAFRSWFAVEAPRGVMWASLGLPEPPPFDVRE